MKSRLQATTAVFRFAILFLFALTAHELSGGTWVQTPQLLIQVLAISLALILARDIDFEGAPLALLITIIQSSSHFVLGGNTYSSEIRMTFGHVVAGVASYVAVSKYERVWEFLTDLANRFRVPPATASWAPFSLIEWPVESLDIFPQLEYLLYSLRYRGPPIEKGLSHAA